MIFLGVPLEKQSAGQAVKNTGTDFTLFQPVTQKTANARAFAGE
jgi:hypothetical protein